MSDLISRQAAIDAIQEAECMAVYEDEISGLVQAEKIIKALPSAEKTELYCTMAGRECFTQGKEIAWCLTCPHISEEDRELVKKAVSADRPKGGWIVTTSNVTSWYICNQCGESGDIQDNYCKHCGADMRGGAE